MGEMLVFKSTHNQCYHILHFLFRVAIMKTRSLLSFQIVSIPVGLRPW